MRKFRILFFNTRMVVGGPAKVTVALAEELAARGHDVALASGDPEADEVSDPRTDRSPLPRHRIPSIHRSVGPFSDLKALQEIRALLKRVRPDVLMTAGAKAGTLGRVAAQFVRPRPRTVHVFHGHVFRGHFSSLAGRAFALAEGGLAKITDELVAISPSVAADLAAFGVDRKARLHTIYIGAELAPFLAAEHGPGEVRRELGIDPAAFLAVYPARICWVKAQDVTIEALGLARERIGATPFKLLFVGDGENREALLARAHELGVAHQVAFAGYREDMPRIYGAADLVVLASRYEGTPVALLEATAAGRPFLATAVGGVKDLWRSGMGRLVPPEDPQALADALVEAISTRPPAVPEAIRREVVQRFSVARFADDVEKMLAETDRAR